ncbi:hypothetical protein CDD83_2349 [Cordyceps sp. RAO-2017]|nr:hypothetical protein CDD83_2349 [Cordyceps sp. RAO-2017]
MATRAGGADGGPDLPADQGQCINLRCRQCGGRDSHIRLDFAIADAKRLVVNGVELYPTAEAEHGLWMTAPVKDEAAGAAAAPREQPLGYGLAVALRASDEAEGVDLVDVDYSIREVDGRPVPGLPTVRVGLIQLVAGDGPLLIGSVATRDNLHISCGAVQCWAYRLAGVAYGVESDEALRRCCGLGAAPPNDTVPAAARPALDWHRAAGIDGVAGFQPWLLGFMAVAVLVSFIMFCVRSRRRRGIRGLCESKAGVGLGSH